MRTFRFFGLTIALVGVAALPPACGSESAEEPSKDAGLDAPSYEPMPVDASACGAVVQSFPLLPSPHVAECSLVEYESNPPSSGPHYGFWAAFGVYDVAIPRGFWVHAMEHGAVVVSYSCTDCADEVTAAKAWIDTLPLDPLCVKTGAVKRRVVLTPDPLLSSRWAAAAWGVTLRSDCFEPAVFTDFYEAHEGHGAENICSDGVTLVNEAGASTLPDTCGSADGGLDAGLDAQFMEAGG